MSKEYNVKYEVGQDVYVLRDKKISKNDLIKIKNQFKLKDESNEERYKKILDCLFYVLFTNIIS